MKDREIERRANTFPSLPSDSRTSLLLGVELSGSDDLLSPAETLNLPLPANGAGLGGGRRAEVSIVIAVLKDQSDVRSIESISSLCSLDWDKRRSNVLTEQVPAPSGEAGSRGDRIMRGSVSPPETMVPAQVSCGARLVSTPRRMGRSRGTGRSCKVRNILTGAGDGGRLGAFNMVVVDWGGIGGGGPGRGEDHSEEGGEVHDG